MNLFKVTKKGKKLIYYIYVLSFLFILTISCFRQTEQCLKPVYLYEKKKKYELSSHPPVACVVTSFDCPSRYMRGLSAKSAAAGNMWQGDSASEALHLRWQAHNDWAMAMAGLQPVEIVFFRYPIFAAHNLFFFCIVKMGQLASFKNNEQRVGRPEWEWSRQLRR